MGEETERSEEAIIMIKKTKEEEEEAKAKGEEAEAQVEIWKYIFGFAEMAVVKCAIELGIADALESHGRSNPMTLSQLSSTLGCSPSMLSRIMRFLMHRNIFKQVDDGYVQTPLSRLLMTHGHHSMASFVLFETTPVMLQPWLHLSARVGGGASPFEAAHGGEDVWSYAATNPGHRKLIDDAMACGARVAVAALVEGCPEVFDGVRSVVDVGGGNGTALGMVVKACPWIHGINFDLPHVVLSSSSSSDGIGGVENVGGDMFLSIPKADAAFLMWVLHDWGDEECIHILRNCREAIPKETGKVIIVEAVIDEEVEEEDNKLKYVGLMLDMVMMAHTNTGKERTPKEWGHVLAEAGFTRHTFKRIHAVQSVIVAYP